MRPAVGRIARALRNYAAAQDWSRDDYRILIETNQQWGRIHVIFVAREFPGEDRRGHRRSVVDFLQEDLGDDSDLLEAMNLVLRTFDQVEQGGIYSVSPGYVDVDDPFTSWPTS